MKLQNIIFIFFICLYLFAFFGVIFLCFSGLSFRIEVIYFNFFEYLNDYILLIFILILILLWCIISCECHYFIYNKRRPFLYLILKGFTTFISFSIAFYFLDLFYIIENDIVINLRFFFIIRDVDFEFKQLIFENVFILAVLNSNIADIAKIQILTNDYITLFEPNLTKNFLISISIKSLVLLAKKHAYFICSSFADEVEIVPIFSEEFLTFIFVFL